MPRARIQPDPRPGQPPRREVCPRSPSEQAHGRESHHHAQKRQFVRRPSHTHLPDARPRLLLQWQARCHSHLPQDISVQPLTDRSAKFVSPPRQPNPSTVAYLLPPRPCFLSSSCASNRCNSRFPRTLVLRKLSPKRRCEVWDSPTASLPGSISVQPRAKTRIVGE